MNQPANTRELTIRALLLGVALAVILGAANTYLGLYAGLTVSASIPAAVISMAILRGVFRSGTIKENNIVQSVASAGESLAAGVIFTVPAILLVGAWNEFEFWPTTLIAATGGILGVIFMIPLRRALIVERKDLVYPEGVACAEVLQAGETGGGGIRLIALGGLVGAGLKYLGARLIAFPGTVEGAMNYGRRVFYGGVDISAALLGVGYIVGFNVSLLMFLGGFIAWILFLPGLGVFEPTTAFAGVGGGGGADPDTPLGFAWSFWNSQIRYVGVGAMMVGAVESLWGVRKGVFASMRSLRSIPGAEKLPPAERDIGLSQLLIILLISFGATVYLYESMIHTLPAAIVVAAIMIVVAFILVALASYIVGLVGSSNSPVSGMTIVGLLTTSGIVLGLGLQADQAALAILGVAGVVCCAACTSGDISQDLKTGQIIGATPYRQQWAEVIGVAATAPIFAYILTLLNDVYGIGTGEPGSLKAPQAALFAGITNALVGKGELPLDMVAAGALIGVGFLALNPVMKRIGSAFRFHIMPIAVGIYLPLSLSATILIGGLLRLFITRKRNRRGENVGEGQDGGVLFSSGLIAGESLLGIIVAIIVSQEAKNAGSEPFESAALGVILLGLVLALFYWAANRKPS
ncbi:MAG: oligopeptide transporter, OPT family [bacterium]|nr:oligopeptide transporter, OPT family [bacterium]